MAFFKDDAELYHYLGGLFRCVNDDPKLKKIASKAGFTMKLRYTEPEACITTEFTEDGLIVHEGENDIKGDVETLMKGDQADKFWRGEFNFLANVALGRVRLKGKPTALMKLGPLQPSLFKIYKEMIAEKDAQMKE